MNKTRTLIKNIPFIAKCTDPVRFSERNLMIYDYEIENPGSVFSYHDIDKQQNRLAVLEIPAEYIGDSFKYRTAMDRLKIAMLSGDKKRGRITESQDNELSTLVETQSLINEEELDSVMTLDVAVQGVWNS
jgi:hypothetical protein